MPTAQVQLSCAYKVLAGCLVLGWSCWKLFIAKWAIKAATHTSELV